MNKPDREDVYLVDHNGEDEMKNLIGTAWSGYEIIAQVPRSTHPDDRYLQIVSGIRAERDGTYEGVCWIYNASTDGMGHGRYIKPRETWGEACGAVMRLLLDRCGEFTLV